MNQAIIDFYKFLDRSLFLSHKLKLKAQQDVALTIGYGQTISQPSLVLMMTDQLHLEKHHRVLEVGTGSGYQTAFLAEFSKWVYTIEKIKPLSLKAQKRLNKLGYNNITYHIGDGSIGLEEHAPFDRIIVTASASIVPTELITQLAINGRMLIPIGTLHYQDLILFMKDNQGNIHQQTLDNVLFVELVGKYGWNKQ